MGRRPRPSGLHLPNGLAGAAGEHRGSPGVRLIPSSRPQARWWRSGCASARRREAGVHSARHAPESARLGLIDGAGLANTRGGGAKPMLAKPPVGVVRAPAPGARSSWLPRSTGSCASAARRGGCWRHPRRPDRAENAGLFWLGVGNLARQRRRSWRGGSALWPAQVSGRQNWLGAMFRVCVRVVDENQPPGAYGISASSCEY